MWTRTIWLFILFLLGRHICFPAESRYIELADSADFYIAHENWDKAERAIIEALRLEPANFTNSLLLANLGLVQSRKGEYAKALQSLSLGLNIAPSSTVLLNNRAHVYLLSDSLPEAAADLDRSLSIDSIQEWTLTTRAFLYLQEEKFDNATSLFEKVIKTFPENLSVWNGLAAIAGSIGDSQKAMDHYKLVLDKNPEDEEARQAYIFLLIKSDNYSEARSEIRKGLELNENNPMFYLLRGYLHRLNFRLEEAEADKKLAIAKGLDKEFVENYFSE